MKAGKLLLITIVLNGVAHYCAASEVEQKQQAQQIPNLHEIDRKLIEALKKYDVDKVKELLAAGANPNAQVSLVSSYTTDENKQTTIFNNFLYRTTDTWNFEKSDLPTVIELVPLLCKAGAQLDETGQTVFRNLFRQDSLEFIEALYKCGGKLQFNWMEHDAINNEHKSLIFLQWLLDHGMDINDASLGRPLLLFTLDILWIRSNQNQFDHYYNIIKFLLDHGADIGIPGILILEKGGKGERDLFEYLVDLKKSLSNVDYQRLLALFEEPIKKYIAAIRQTGPTGAPRPLPAGVSSIIGEYLVGKPAAEQPKKETPKSAVVSEKDVPDVE